MARIMNHSSRLITIPEITCEETKATLTGYDLPPGETAVSDDYAANALGLAREGHDLFVIRGKKDGHAGIRKLFTPGLKLLELIDGDEVAPLFPNLAEMSAGDAVELIGSTNDRPTIHHWFKIGDARKTVQKALTDKASAIGVDRGE